MATPSTESRLSTWLSRCKMKGTKRPVVTFKFFRLGRAGASSLMFEEEANLSQLEADEAAQPLAARLEEDAGNQGGRASYQVTCTYQGQTEHFELVVLPVQAPAGLVTPLEGQEGGPAYGSAAATQAALAQQQGNTLMQTASMLIRHNEKIFEMYTRLIGEANTTLSNQIAAKDARIKELEAERAQSILMQEQMLSAQTERDLLRIKEENEERRKDDAMREALPMVSMLIGKYLGNSQEGGAKTLFNKGLISFFESMTQDQFEKIVEPMSEQQRVMFYMVWEEAQKYIDEQKKDKAHANDNKPNGRAQA